MKKKTQNLYEGVPSPIQPLTQYSQLVQQFGEEFADALMQIIPVYSFNDLLKEIHKLCSSRKDMVPVNLDRFAYRDEYLVGYLSKTAVAAAQNAYAAGYALRSPLMAYELLFFDNPIANSFSIIHHQDIGQYGSWRSNAIDAVVRQELYKNLCMLARQDICIEPDALAYHPENRDFKVMNFQEVYLGRLSTPKKISDYQEQYRELLQIR